MGTNEVIRFFEDKRVVLTTRLLDGGEDLLIEGSPASLMMLSKLIEAVAIHERFGKFHMSPHGAGCSHFSKDAKFGLYIHRVDEADGTD